MAANTANANLGIPLGLNRLGTPEIITGMKVQHYTENSALAYSSKLLYTFPLGKILPIMVTDYLLFTTTSVIADSLNSGVAVSHGFGSAAASNIVLSTTMQDFLPGTGIAVSNFTSSTVINVAPAAIATYKSSVPIPIDGSSTALPLYLNLAVPTITDIDATVPTATLTVTGRLLILWLNMGGFAYYPSALA